VCKLQGDLERTPTRRIHSGSKKNGLLISCGRAIAPPGADPPGAQGERAKGQKAHGGWFRHYTHAEPGPGVVIGIAENGHVWTSTVGRIGKADINPAIVGDAAMRRVFKDECQVLMIVARRKTAKGVDLAHEANGR